MGVTKLTSNKTFVDLFKVIVELIGCPHRPQIAMLNEKLRNSNVVLLLQTFVRLCRYRAAAAASAAVFHAVDTELQATKTKWERAKDYKEHCAAEYNEFKTHAHDLTELAVIFDQQVPGKNFSTLYALVNSPRCSWHPYT